MRAHALHPSSQRSLSPHNEGGNTKPRHVLNGPTERRSFSLECLTQQKALVRSHGGPGAGLVLLICPNLSSDQTRPAPVSSCSPPSLASALFPNRAFLPVWPSTRLFCARAACWTFVALRKPNPPRTIGKLAVSRIPRPGLVISA